MRVIALAVVIFTVSLAAAMSDVVPTTFAQTAAASSRMQKARDAVPNHHRGLVHLGRKIFRFDTFGDEQLWTDVLRMHEVLPGISPVTALGVGLKVDVEALPPSLIDALKAGAVDLNDPAVTIELLRLDAVVGVRGEVDDAGTLTKVGITCALCHSTVDNSLAPGIGRRLDGWANTTLNVGAIVSLSPALDPATKDEFMEWGPGKYDPRHHIFDGAAIRPLNSPSIPVVIPSIYGLQGVGFETFTGDGPISYWNAYVGISQMGGQGTFRDPRIGVFIHQQPDLVTPKLLPLLAYQLTLKPPAPPKGSFDPKAAARGKQLFRGQARCASCHRGPRLTDVRHGSPPFVPRLHAPEETGMDPQYAARSATGKYRTTPLRGLLQHPPYFHDGSAADLAAVVDHYDTFFGLNLTRRQKRDLVEYLKSL